MDRLRPPARTQPCPPRRRHHCRPRTRQAPATRTPGTAHRPPPSRPTVPRRPQSRFPRTAAVPAAVATQQRRPRRCQPRCTAVRRRQTTGPAGRACSWLRSLLWQYSCCRVAGRGFCMEHQNVLLSDARSCSWLSRALLRELCSCSCPPVRSCASATFNSNF